MKGMSILLIIALFTHGLFQMSSDPELTIKDEFCHDEAYFEECYEEIVYSNSFEEIVYKEIVDAGIEFPEVVLRQALLETGDFSSKVFQENCNLFGMKQARVRETTAMGTSRNHAVYTNWKASIQDYKHWQDYNFERDSCNGDYYSYLIKRKYATDRSYIHKLKSVKLKTEENV